MRRVFVVAVLGVSSSIGPAMAQEATRSGTPTTQRKHVPTVGDSLFENGPDRPHALDDVRRAEAHPVSEKASEANAAPSQSRPTAPVIPTVAPAPPGPPQKSLTGDEFKLIHIGFTEKQVLQVLGPPSSQIVVPDDDDHLRETLQYWVKGVPTATVRLDNGRVVAIETKRN